MQIGSKHRQRGATFLGIMTIVAIVGLALYAGIRLVPLYMDYMSVTRAMTQIATSLQGSEVNSSTVRTALVHHWMTDYITSVSANDIEITKVATGVEMRAAYEAKAPFIANISFVVEFDKAVVIPTGGRP